MPSNESSEKPPGRDGTSGPEDGPESVAEMVRQVCYEHLSDRIARRLTRALAETVPGRVWTSEDREKIRAAQDAAQRYIDRHQELTRPSSAS